MLNTCINGREKLGLLEGDEKIWGAYDQDALFTYMKLSKN